MPTTWATRRGFTGLLARRDDGTLVAAAYGVLVTHPHSSARRLYELAGWRRAGRFTVLGGLDRIVHALDSHPPRV